MYISACEKGEGKIGIRGSIGNRDSYSNSATVENISGALEALCEKALWN